jgi:PiT family inorganic phosphate transporter
MHTIQISVVVLSILIALALLFDFMNGFHDAANAIATVVSTRVLKPHTAVAMAAIFNFVAVLIFPLTVAATVGKDTVDPAIVDQYVIFGALVGAVFWNFVTWFFGIPSSSSHALIGGLVGSAVAKAGSGALIPAGLIKIVIFIVLSPLLGFVFGSIMMILVSWLFVNSTPRRVDNWFRRMQLISASMYSLGHGGNDAQKTIGIIWMLLIAAGRIKINDGVPSRRWGKRSRSSNRWAASAQKPVARLRCSSPPHLACQYRLRTPSPALSSASAHRKRCRRCVGVLQAISSGRGF